MVERPSAPRAEMGERPLRPPGAEIAGQRDPDEQGRQAEGEAVESELGQADAAPRAPSLITAAMKPKQVAAPIRRAMPSRRFCLQGEDGGAVIRQRIRH